MSLRLQRSIIICSLLFVSLTNATCFGQRSDQPSYSVGEKIDGSSEVIDKNLATHRLSEIVEAPTRVVVLVMIGGAAPSAPDWHPLRAGLWCPDTFDELPLIRALMRQFKDDPVQFVPIAMPPAYSDVYGFEKDVFTRNSDTDPVYISEVERFIELTERTKDTDVLPFDEVYYDPRYRLAQDRSRPVGDGYGDVREWQGKLRWSGDPRKYGTPALWLLTGELEVAREPFVGNTYNAEPPDIRYGFNEVREAIESVMNRN